MTLRDPIVIAIIRGLYTAVGMGSLMWLTVYSATNDTRAAWIAGALAFLGALGFRGGVEGAIDQRKGPRPDEPWEPTPAQRHARLAPGPVPVIDFDDPYHIGKDDQRHPGQDPTKCQWCIAHFNRRA
jgi:hypothetical protein